MACTTCEGLDVRVGLTKDRLTFGWLVYRAPFECVAWGEEANMGDAMKAAARAARHPRPRPAVREHRSAERTPASEP